MHKVLLANGHVVPDMFCRANFVSVRGPLSVYQTSNVVSRYRQQGAAANVSSDMTVRNLVCQNNTHLAVAVTSDLLLGTTHSA